MTDKHIQAIDKITALKNVKALQRVLGMLNYWKKHVPHYSKKYLQHAPTPAQGRPV